MPPGSLGPFVSNFSFHNLTDNTRRHPPVGTLNFGSSLPLHRATLTDLRNKIGLEFWLNPETFTYTIEPEFSKQTVMGYSHQPKNYSHTKNRRIGPLTFMMSARLQRSLGLLDSVAHLKQALGFLDSLCYASERRNQFENTDPVALFEWTGMASMEVTIDNLQVKIMEMSSGEEAHPLVVQVTLEMSESFDVRAHSHQFLEADPWLDHSAVGKRPPTTFSIKGLGAPQGGRGGK